jgi:hypothetical protein
MSIVSELFEEIAKIRGKISIIQEKCSHPEEALLKEHGSNTGNYDPSVDCYWTNFHCKLCLKSWSEEGSK